MLTVHHLQTSQSERIVWLCEELGIAYQLKRYLRDPVTRLAPSRIKALHPMGIAPVITDGSLVLGESAAIADYLIHRYGDGLGHTQIFIGDDTGENRSNRHIDDRAYEQRSQNTDRHVAAGIL